MSAIDDLTPVPDQPEISEGNQAFHAKAYALYKWMREKLAPAVIELRNLIVNAVTGSFTSTSGTSFTIGTGDISITIGTGLGFVPGTSIRSAYMTDPTKYVDGIVKTYNSSTGALIFAGQTTAGAGTYANWSISIIASSGTFASLVSNKFTALQTWANEVTIASATTIDLAAAGSNQFKLTGTVQVEGATMPQGAIIKGRAVAATPLKNSATFIVQGGADYTCAAGDWLEFKKDGDGNVHVSITSIAQLKKTSSAKAIAGTDDADFMTALSTRQAYPLRTLMTAWSAPYTPASGESLSANHGLSTVPYAVSLVLECVVAELGYAVGDRVTPGGYWNGSSTNTLAPYANATTVGIKCVSGFSVYIQNPSTGAAATPGAGKWKYAFKIEV